MTKKLKLLKIIKDMIKDGSLINIAMMPKEQQENIIKQYLNKKYGKNSDEIIANTRKQLPNIFPNNTIYVDTDSIYIKTKKHECNKNCLKCEDYGQCDRSYEKC